MAKILCPNHKDTNPSCEVYEDWLHCFVCGYRAKRGDDDYEFEAKQPTDIGAMLDYIKSLPTREIRGLILPFDAQGYFLVWPSGDYYKQRLWEPCGKTRYLAPTGHKPPLFRKNNSSKTIVVVEGEFNALSLMCIQPPYTIVSPGAATQLSEYISVYINYEIVYIIVDRDIPGVAGGVELKRQLLKQGKIVHLVAKEKDYNQTLQDKGPDGLKEEACRDLDLI